MYNRTVCEERSHQSRVQRVKKKTKQNVRACNLVTDGLKLNPPAQSDENALQD